MTTSEPTTTRSRAFQATNLHRVHDAISDPQSTTQRGSRIAELLVELLTDEAGRRALMEIIAGDLAQRDLTCRGLHVVDRFGRQRVDIEASDTAGEVRLRGFSPTDTTTDGASNCVILSTDEECGEGPSGHIGIWSGDKAVVFFGASEGAYGQPGSPTIELERHEHDGTYLPSGERRFVKTQHATVSPDGVDANSAS